MGRGSKDLIAASAPYVCVRITDMSAVDVAAIRFDFDLTFAAVLMNADGTIYHRFGSRGSKDANEYLSLGALAQLLRDTLLDHAEYERAPAPPPAQPPLPAIELPVLKQKIAAGQRLDCVHCHTVNDAEHAEAVLQKRWQKNDLFVFPDPARVGLTLDVQRQSVVTAVIADSAAQKAGLRAGDELVSLGEQRHTRTLSDVQWALHRAPFEATTLPVRYRRANEEHAAELALPTGWKRCPPEDYAWRPYKWNLSPSSGFGGPALDDAARRALAIEAGTFAFKIGYLVDWGEQAHRGRIAKAAGLRKGDVVVAFAGKHDFASVEHFHAWVALTRTAGEDTEIVVLRDGKRLVLHYPLPE